MSSSYFNSRFWLGLCLQGERLCPESNSGPSIHRAKDLPLGHVEHRKRTVEILLFKPSSLIKREFKHISQKNDGSFDSENPAQMHFIAFTCKEWKPNSLGRNGINSSASKTCFVIAMFAHMLRLIIQNRFHLLLKYFSIRNSLSDFPSAPLFVDAVSIFVACAAEFEAGVLAPEDFSVSNLPLRGFTIRRSCVCCSICMRNGLSFTDSKHCFVDDEKTALYEYFGH